MSQYFYITLLTFILYSCSESIENNNSVPKNIFLNDLIEIDKIDSAIVFNNKGQHLIPYNKMNLLKDQLHKMKLENQSLKLGIKHFTIFIEGKSIQFGSANNSNFIEFHSNQISKNKDFVEKG